MYAVPLRVKCLAGSTISEWQLDDGYWRADEESANVYECLFGSVSYPGTKVLDAANYSSFDTKSPYCGCGYVGPFCAVCARDYYQSWGDNPCEDCRDRNGHAQTFVVMGSLFILTIAGVVFAITKKKRIVNSTCYLIARYFYRLGRAKMSFSSLCRY
jgi:hypothetical protein